MTSSAVAIAAISLVAGLMVVVGRSRTRRRLEDLGRMIGAQVQADPDTSHDEFLQPAWNAWSGDNVFRFDSVLRSSGDKPRFWIVNLEYAEYSFHVDNPLGRVTVIVIEISNGGAVPAPATILDGFHASTSEGKLYFYRGSAGRFAGVLLSADEIPDALAMAMALVAPRSDHNRLTR